MRSRESGQESGENYEFQQEGSGRFVAVFHIFPVIPCISGNSAALRRLGPATTSAAMITRDQWRKFMDSPVVEWTLFAVGVLLVIAGFAVAPIPGPGGVFLIAPGLALILKTSLWAKRRYVKFKRWQPKAGRWADWALRRRSAKRRERLAKADQAGGSN
jgi:hypothetical protein